MLSGKTIAVVVPAYNEELLIAKTLTTMPEFVDNILVINDASKDNTRQIIADLALNDERIELINHEVNKGLGQSLIDGYLHARDKELDVIAVMAGDAQMSPDDLERVTEPVVNEHVDYVKGNRLFVSDVAEHMPLHRLVGNAGLTILTKFATGYWHVVDPQCGYTAISRYALSHIPIEQMVKGYGYNADLLNMLNILNMRVADVEVQPVYGEEQSKIKLHKYIPSVSYLLVRLFFRRLVKKYLMRDFNPVCLSYFAGLFLLVAVASPLAIRFLYIYFLADSPDFPQTTLICLMFSSIAGIQILLSAVQYDLEDNRDLCIKIMDGRFDS